MRSITTLCLSVLLAFTFAANTFAGTAGLSQTALDRYVAAPDDHYKYEVVDTVKGEGYTTYVIFMTSQKWLTEKEVNLPIWEHWMTVTKPDTVVSDIGFLYITGGNKGKKAPSGPPPGDAERALMSQSVVTTLYMVPNQPLVFVGDETISRGEDAAIAYTWDKHLRTGDDKWPMRLPMTKSAVRAMDTVTNLMASEAGGKIEVDQFVVAGGSKRGWTTWTTAVVDDRVVGIMPIVIDMLNVGPSFKHHYEVYGGYSPAVNDYVQMGLMDWNGTPEYERLLEIVEPYQYRDRLTLPKFLLNSTQDEFFLPDSWQFYWDDLVGEKHVRYVPNASHSMGGTDVIDSVNAWYHALVHNVSVPRYNWDVAEDGTITVFTLDKPDAVLLWQAHNPKGRSFMKFAVGNGAYTSTPLTEVEPGKYVAKVDAPKEGHICYFVELHYPSGTTVPFKFTSGTKVVPDTVKHKWKPSPKSKREKLPVHK